MSVEASSATIKTFQKEDAPVEDLLDSEGLSISGYDTVIIGTSLVQCVLCAALARVGQSVLHCDSSDRYGRLESGGFRSVPEIVKFLKELAQESDVKICSSSSGMEEERGYSLDLSPLLVSSAQDGPEIRQLLKSGVHRYLEFQVIGSQHILTDGRLSRAPLGKADVFSSRVLSPMDKRRIMKVLRLAFDLGTSSSSLDGFSDGDGKNTVQTLNERTLASGRALHRPQNAEANAGDIVSLLPGGDTYNVPFDSYLKDRHGIKNNSLRSWVVDALSLSVDPNVKAGEGMAAIYHRMMAIRSYGSPTGMLGICYGSGEVGQGFARAGAVRGAAFLLRRGAGKVWEEREDHEGKRTLRMILKGDKNGDEYGAYKEDKVLKCSSVVLPANSIQSPSRKICQKTRLLRHISILNKPLSPLEVSIDRFSSTPAPEPTSIQSDSSGLIVIPPHTAGVENKHVIHCVYGGGDLHWTPRSNGVAYWSTTITLDEDESWDNDVLQRSVEHVLKQRNAAATTIAATMEKTATPAATSLLKDGVPLAQEDGGSSISDPKTLTDVIYEVHHVCYSVGDGTFADSDSMLEDGMFVCRGAPQATTLKWVFEEAERLFHEICPGKEFFLDHKIKGQNEDGNEENTAIDEEEEEDEDDAVLRNIEL